jgi:hypothetical protein
MRLLAIDDVREDVVLARSVPSGRPDGVPLLRAGATVGAALAARIAASGVGGVWIDDDLGRDIAPLPEFPADAIGIALHATTAALDDAPRALAAGRELDARFMRELQDAAGEFADAVLSYPGDLCPISDVAVARATAPWHAVRVALLGAFIGMRALAKTGWIDYQGVQRFDGLEERLSTLILGLLVHDIGATTDGEAGACMAPESEQTPEHVAKGLSLFAAESAPMAMRAAIQSHHERWDGTGYPQGKIRDTTAMNARIAAIADTFDALVATGGVRTPLPPHAAVRTIAQAAGSQFDPALVAHFEALVMPYPVGHELCLPDGRSAVVVSLPVGDRFRPTVRLQVDGGPIVELVADLLPGRVGVGAAA